MIINKDIQHEKKKDSSINGKGLVPTSKPPMVSCIQSFIIYMIYINKNKDILILN